MGNDLAQHIIFGGNSMKKNKLIKHTQDIGMAGLNLGVTSSVLGGIGTPTSQNLAGKLGSVGRMGIGIAGVTGYGTILTDMLKKQGKKKR